jgi:hypothetical protein
LRQIVGKAKRGKLQERKAVEHVGARVMSGEHLLREMDNLRFVLC